MIVGTDSLKSNDDLNIQSSYYLIRSPDHDLQFSETVIQIPITEKRTGRLFVQNRDHVIILKSWIDKMRK